MEDETAEKEVKKAMHMGDGRVLNVYFSKLSKTLGYATFPSSLQPDIVYLDGVVVHRDAGVGGDIMRFSEGDMLAHQVGYVSPFKKRKAASIKTNTIGF